MVSDQDVPVTMQLKQYLTVLEANPNLCLMLISQNALTA